MDEQDTVARRRPPETADFAVVVQGAAPEARVVRGLDAVKEIVLRAIRRAPGEVALEAVAGLAESLEDPGAWMEHGSGDGRPFWHWWFGFEGGSVAVQRLTESPSSPEGRDASHAALAEVVAALADAARELRRLGRGDEDRGAYVFTARRPTAGRLG